MKSIISIFVFVLSMVSFKAISQNLIAVQNGNTPSFYQQVDSAIVHSQNGDTIFVPGGTWNISQQINKRIHFIGVGHNPDSTTATFQTKFNGHFSLTGGASNGSITGVYFVYIIGAYSDAISYYQISRCNISAVSLNQYCNNFTFYENIFRDVIINNSGTNGIANCSFFNNIFNCYFGNGTQATFVNSVFRNNIFCYNSTYGEGGSWTFSISAQYCQFENNIFAGTTWNLQACNNSTFINNLFTENIDCVPGTNVGSNCITNQPLSSIFINLISLNPFDYQNNYHLQPTCPGKNAGTDGTDLGIYGGSSPWKDGSVPFNPHIQIKQISGTTNSSGNLPVNIKVSAQDH